ncbi:MAG TPA: hypothetical protein VE547_19460 [Mycobacteriales bacterium]|nr:hypothetical protein [Mycobacteriales bacterium]
MTEDDVRVFPRALAKRLRLPGSLAARLPGAVPVLSFVTVGDRGLVCSG